MAYFPAFINLENKLIVVVGAGSVATRKIEILLNFGPKIKVVADRVSEKVKALAEEGKVELIKRKFRLSDLSKAFMVIVAVDDINLQRKVYEYCKKRGILCNSVDSPDFCTFLFPALVMRGNLVVGVSTSGNAPIVSKLIREKLENFLPKELSDVVNQAELMRKIYKERKDSKILDEIKKLIDDAFRET